MFWREQGVGDQVVVRFAGVLDATSARDVKRFLGSDAPGNVVLDFSRASDVDYYGLSALVAEIAQSGRSVLLRGLHVNHVRMLRYFDVDPAHLGLTEGPSLDAAWR